MSIVGKLSSRTLEFWLNNGSISMIYFALNKNRTTIWRMFKRISATLIDKYNNIFDKIGGINTIVEIYESKLGKRKYNKGHRVKGAWIFGMVERTNERKIRLMAVEDRKAETLDGILRKHVDARSTIYSDCWAEYKNIVKNFSEHLRVNHSLHFKYLVTGVNTTCFESN